MPCSPRPINTDRLTEAFHRNFTDHGEIGASLSIWQDGREILSLHGGSRTRDEVATWHDDTLVPVWSATKGPASLAFLLLLHDAGISLDEPVQSIWPEMQTRFSFGQMLSHQAGLPALDSLPSVFDHESVTAALAAQAPQWPPGSAHGYHPRTFGFLLDECARRLSGGLPLGATLASRIAQPLKADFWISLPTSEHHRVARLYPGKAKPAASPDESAFFSAFQSPDSLTRRAFASPAGLHAVSDMNLPETWMASLPAHGGIGSARGLAAIYSLLATDGSWKGKQIVPPTVLSWTGHRLANGHDRVLLMPTAFSAGFMMDPLGPDGSPLQNRFGHNPAARGHPGAGGSLAFADPDRRLAFAYVMNQMEQGVMPGTKARALVAALGAC
jgi:CubicO group peptidase (beta-lactamase class C family)